MKPETANELNEWLLPEEIKRIKNKCGWDVALALLEECAGTAVFIPLPKNLPITDPENRLFRLQPGQVLKLARLYPGQYFSVPKCHHALLKLRNDSIRVMRTEGKAVRDIAQQFNLTERQIWSILGPSMPDSRQQSLF